MIRVTIIFFPRFLYWLFLWLAYLLDYLLCWWTEAQSCLFCWFQIFDFIWILLMTSSSLFNWEHIENPSIFNQVDLGFLHTLFLGILPSRKRLWIHYRSTSVVCFRFKYACVLLPLIFFFLFQTVHHLSPLSDILLVHLIIPIIFLVQSLYRKNCIFIIAGDKYWSGSNINAMIVRTCLLSLLDPSSWIFLLILSNVLTLYPSKVQITLCLFLSCD